MGSGRQRQAVALLAGLACLLGACVQTARAGPGKGKGTRVTLPESRVFATGQCKHGLFTWLRSDVYIGRSLDAYGEWSEGEVKYVYNVLIEESDVVLDIGANIGTMTVPMARRARQGTVHAFEPFRVLSSLIAHNAIMNDLTNVVVHRAVVSDNLKPVKIPHGDFSGPNNYGSVPLDVPEGTPQGYYDLTPSVTIDSLKLDAVHFMKIDVEGHELQVLRGAKKTIRAHRPFIYAEFDRPATNKLLVQYLQRELQYSCFLHKVPLFPGPRNFKENEADIFGAELQSVNMLCVPDSPPDESRTVPKKLLKVPITLETAGRPIDEL